MKNRLRWFCALLAVMLAAGPSAIAQETPDPFAMGLGVGTESFTGEGTYQTIAFTPDFAIGNFGIGVALTLHFRFTGGDANDKFEVRTAGDWVPLEEGPTLSDWSRLYLPKVRYVRYGERGEPLFVKLGMIDDATLGNGFIMSNYSNTLFLPDERIFGMNFNIDGSLVDFPYIGFETFVGNLAVWDVLGARVYTRPLMPFGIPIISNLQIGTSLVVDRNPYLRAANIDAGAGDSPRAFGLGADFLLPLLTGNALSLALLGDVASLSANDPDLEGGALGGAVGFGGRLIKFLSYGAQLRFLGSGFIPTYFDTTYDVYRSERYRLISGEATGEPNPAYMGWFASLGTSLFNDSVVFNMSLDGPFSIVVADAAAVAVALNNPHLRGIFVIQEGILPGVSFDASYDKAAITSIQDLVDPTNAVIKARLNYATGPAVISFVYNFRYDPEAAADGDVSPWNVTSGLETSFQLF